MNLKLYRSFSISHLCASVKFHFCHFDHSLWWTVQEYQLRKQVLLHEELSALSDQVNIEAQVQYTVHTGQLLPHDLVWQVTYEDAQKLTNNYDHGHIQAEDAAMEGYIVSAI